MKEFRVILYSLVILFFSCKEEKTVFIQFPENIIVDTIPLYNTFPDKLLIDVLINGERYKFLFDSGADKTLINSSIPSKMTSVDTVFLYDVANKIHPSFQVSIDTFQIGGVKVIQMDSYLQRDLILDGILGVDIIGNLVWKIDLIDRKILVTEDIKNFKLKDEGIAFTKKEGSIEIKLNINGEEFEVIVDTGHTGFISLNNHNIDLLEINPVLWEDISTLHFGNPFRSKNYAPHMDSTYYTSVKIELGEIELGNEIIKFHDKIENYIGLDFIKRFNYMIIDFPNRKLYFGEEQKKSLNFLSTSLLRLNSKGIILDKSESALLINGLTNRAKESGLNYGDTVISIDGKSLVDRDSSFYRDRSIWHKDINFLEFNPSEFQQLWNEFHFLKDTSIIEVQKGRSTKKFTLTRKYTFTEMPDSLQDYYLDMSFHSAKFKKVKTESSSYYTFKTQDLLPLRLRKN